MNLTKNISKQEEIKEPAVVKSEASLGNLWLRSYIHENTSMMEELAQQSGQEAGQHFLFDAYKNHKELICFDQPSAYASKDVANTLRKENQVHNMKLYSLVSRLSPEITQARENCFSNEHHFYNTPPGKTFQGNI